VPGCSAQGKDDVARDENANGKATQGKPRKGRSSSVVMRRMLGIMAVMPLASRAPQYTRLIWALTMDSRMPPARKALLAGAAGYLVLGRDLIPDEIPIIGGLDDLVVVVLAVELFLDGVPSGLLDEKIVELGIDKRAFDEDLARIRRMTPGPVRRLIRRIPSVVATVGDAVQHSGLGPRVRAWIDKEEGSLA
jgi:uncharacterized membrane protein YkvA (DUF1232 family)